MKKLESTKRIIVLLFGLIELLLQTSVYAWFWYHVYYPLLSLPRISTEGYALVMELSHNFEELFL